jgi:hypothetical protein
VNGEVEKRMDNWNTPTTAERISSFVYTDRSDTVDRVQRALLDDAVSCVQNVKPGEVTEVMRAVSARFSLEESLLLQAGFASFFGHRENVGEVFMTVNKRREYEFIPPHSEGNSFVGMQLAAFYCNENTTDGGHTVLLNVDSENPVWETLREKIVRGLADAGGIAARDIPRVRGLYQLQPPFTGPTATDIVLEQERAAVAGLQLCTVLAKPKRSHSAILRRDVFAFWDSVGSIDSDCARQFSQLLQDEGLLRRPSVNKSWKSMDNAAERHRWSSQVPLGKIFKGKVVKKMAPGELIIVNNLTWAHAVSNWTPNSGIRSVVAAFA